MTANTATTATQKPCRKCGGTGKVATDWVDNGRCHSCWGSGIAQARYDRTITVKGIEIRVVGKGPNWMVEFNGQVTYFTDGDEARAFANSSYRSVR